MAEYLLMYGRPCVSLDAPPVVYEAEHLRAEHPDDSAAIRWARDEVPHEYGVPQVAKEYPAVPMALWRIEPTERELVWESRPGMASRVAD